MKTVRERCLQDIAWACYFITLLMAGMHYMVGMDYACLGLLALSQGELAVIWIFLR
jgi:hypothetical protein